jgi:hypothetical protein
MSDMFYYINARAFDSPGGQELILPKYIKSHQWFELPPEVRISMIFSSRDVPVDLMNDALADAEDDFIVGEQV